MALGSALLPLPRASLVENPAIISAYAAPVLFIGGTIVAQLAWPGYDPISRTVSELAAGDAPTRVFMTLIFALTASCHLVTSIYAVGIGLPGRVVIAAASLSTFAVAANPLPSAAGTSAAHRLSAIIGFILLAVWPVFGMRTGRGFPWLLRPAGAILGVVVLGAFCFWFLAIWSNPHSSTTGLVERFATDAESLWPALVVTALLVRSLQLTRK